MKVQYYNWTNAGISGKVDIKAKAAGCLGGNGDWNDLQSYAASNGVTIYPVSENETFRSGSGFYTFQDTAVRISGSYARIYDYNLAYGTQSTVNKPLSLLSPSAFSEVAEKLTGSLQKKDLNTLSLGSLTTALYGDYGKQAISRDAAQQLLEDAYQQITDADISPAGERSQCLRSALCAGDHRRAAAIQRIRCVRRGHSVLPDGNARGEILRHQCGECFGNTGRNRASPLPPAAACTLT